MLAAAPHWLLTAHCVDLLSHPRGDFYDAGVIRNAGLLYAHPVPFGEGAVRRGRHGLGCRRGLGVARPVLTDLHPLGKADVAAQPDAVHDDRVFADGALVVAEGLDARILRGVLLEPSLYWACYGTPGSTVPLQVPSLENFKAIHMGVMDGSVVAIKNDGTVWEWGDRQISSGLSFPADNTTPHQVPNLTGIQAISIGGSFVLALKNDGTVWSYGANYCGQLGNGNTTLQRIPAQVPGISNVVTISAGYEHSTAAKEDGSLWAWGSNRDYISGTGYVVRNRLSPEKVRWMESITTITAGNWGATSAGNIWNWEFYNDNGPSPATNMNGFFTVSVSSVNASHGLALRDDGSVWSWGNNDYGQLGNPSPSGLLNLSYYLSNNLAPVSGPNGIGTFKAFESNVTSHTNVVICAVTFDLDGGLYNGNPTISPVDVEYDTFLYLPEPTKDGYRFRGWTDGVSTCSGTLIYYDTTFAAVWRVITPGELRYDAAKNEWDWYGYDEGLVRVYSDEAKAIRDQNLHLPSVVVDYLNSFTLEQYEDTSTRNAAYAHAAELYENVLRQIEDAGYTDVTLAQYNQLIAISDEFSQYINELGRLNDSDLTTGTVEQLQAQLSSMTSNYNIALSIKSGTIDQLSVQFYAVAESAISPLHTHSWSVDWKKDATGHWKDCGCGERSNFAGHAPGDWIIDVAATETTEGSRHRDCTVCGYRENGTLPATGGGGTPPPTKGIFGTNAKWYGAWWHYLLFFIRFGFLWMWF